MLAGVGPNGFTDIYEVKILICYLLFFINENITKEQINKFLLEEEIVDYFILNQALKDLLDTNHISIDTNNNIILENLGKETAEKLKFSLPKSLRENIIVKALKFLGEVKREKDYQVLINKVEDGYIVKGIIHDIGSNLLEFSFFAPDKIQAEFIKDKFKRDPLSVYKAFLYVFTDDGQGLIDMGEKLR